MNGLPAQILECFGTVDAAISRMPVLVFSFLFFFPLDQLNILFSLFIILIISSPGLILTGPFQISLIYVLLLGFTRQGGRGRIG